MGLDRLYSPKQQEVLRFAANNDFFMLINHGAKRSGKTVIDNDLFLQELRRVRRIADINGVSSPQYILAGADLSAINRNVLNELSNKYGLTFKFDKFNRFSLFGVKVCCFGHSKINDLGRIRGMTAYGAYINEATISNREVFNEIKSRCSGDGARIIMDTNPDRPGHWLKKDFIDKADQRTIAEFHWSLDDNTFLTKRYIDSIKDSTPSGMFYDRDINGAWVAANGIIYPDFKRNVHYIKASQVPPIEYHFVGVDFGWEHPGAFVLFGKGIDGKLYITRIWCKKYRSIDDWIRIANQDIIANCGDILFYCDSARPDLIEEMCQNGIRALGARKDVVAGIGEVGTLLKTENIYIVEDCGEGFDEFDEEIDMYAWEDNADAPVKEKDDVMDAMRYGAYSDKFYGNR